VATACVRDHRDSVGLAEQSTEPAAEEVVVVYDEDPNGLLFA
jgi:hypothetical protein